jgi:small subunit ribosomal protein S6
MPQYEMVYIVRPDLEPDAVQAVVGRIGQRVTDLAGTVDIVEVWGKRRLASALGKFREGIYVLTRFTIDSTHIPEFKRLTRIMDEVMRLLIVEAEGPLPAPKVAVERPAEPPKEVAAAPEPEVLEPAPEGASSEGS